MKANLLQAAIVALFLAAGGQAQTLTHRYSFYNTPNNTAAAVDSIGSANGTLQGGAYINGGQLILSGSSGCCASLPNGLITGYTALTVEAWADFGALPANCYLFSFGATDYGGAGEDYVFCAPQAARITITDSDPGYLGEENASCSGWSGRTGQHIVAVFDAPHGCLALYTNGVLAAVNNSENYPLTAVNDVYNYIGRSLYTADPYAPIKVDEFRIWNGAMNGLQAAADFAAGETVTNASIGTVTNLTLQLLATMAPGSQQSVSVLAKSTAVPRPADVTHFCAYASANTNVFAVASNGLIIAVAAGTAMLQVQFAGSVTNQMITVSAPPVVLTHRYSFGTGTANDQVGTANGTLAGSAHITGGQLVLPNTTSAAPATDYLQLPAGILTNSTGAMDAAVTVESWASISPGQYTWANLFDFGNRDASGSAEYDIHVCVHAGDNATVIGISDSDNANVTYQYLDLGSGSSLDGNTNILIAAVFNPPDGYLAIYLNGVLEGIDPNITIPMSGVEDIRNIVGADNWSDPGMKGSISEFRIYNGALTPQQIALDAAAGPSQILTNPGALNSINLVVTNQMALGAAVQAAALGNFSNVTNLNLIGFGQPTFVSSNPAVASISASGLITSLSPGTATIAVTYQGMTASQSITVGAFPTNNFIFDNFGDGFWAIINQGNGLVLAPNFSSSTQQPYTNGATSQQFEVLYNLQNSTFRLRQRSNWRGLGVASAVPGAAIYAVPFYGGLPAQAWRLVNVGAGAYRIFNAVSNLVMQTDNGSPPRVTLQPPSSSPYQLWHFSYQAHYPKKGSAGYEGDYSELGLSWAYNYDDHTGVSLPAQVDFVPMVWGQYWEPVSDLQSRDSGWLAEPQPDYLLTFNEPDNSSQANMSVSTAISMWPSLEALNTPLIGPGTQNTKDSWENSFYQTIASNGYRVDYAAAHEYVPPNASSLIGDMQSVFSAYGKPVWLTEFSPVDWSGCQCWSEDDDYNFLAEFMWQAENNDWFKRYAIFPFSNSNGDSPWVDNGFTGSVFLSDGATLSPYGELYAAWDGDETLHPRKAYILHNLGTSFRMTDVIGVNTPQSSTIYARNATTEWGLLAAPEPNHWYIISLNDGRRLRNNGGTLDLAPYGTANGTVDWWFNGPDGNGYYYLDNLAAAQSIRATGTAPAISFSMINDPAPSASTQWRLVEPYQPISIPAPAAPALAATAGDQTVALIWSTADSFYNVCRSTNNGGPYTQIANLVTNTSFTDDAVQDGVIYYYVVSGLNILGEQSPYSIQASAQPVSLASPLIFVGAAANGATVNLSWPSDHTGWTLQVQTNSLGANWFNVSGSTLTNSIALPINSASGSVFYRLVYP